MPDDGGWDYGTNLDYLKQLCAYWVDEYDWRKHEADLNRFAHYRTEIDDIDLHFIHEPGSGPTPMPPWLARVSRRIQRYYRAAGLS